jgi:hypothetical protein
MGKFPTSLLAGPSHQNNKQYSVTDRIENATLFCHWILHFPKMARQFVAFSANYVYRIGLATVMIWIKTGDSIIGAFAI